MALTTTFMYSNAIYGVNSSQFFGPNLLAMVNANLDARLPVAFGIYGRFGFARFEGHEILCDGYGYSLSTLYHHINMGWGGQDNAWYALPVIDTGDGNAYCTNITSCIYNIFTNGVGEIISGRVVDSNGTAIPGATVTAASTSLMSDIATTDTNGIYALTCLPSASEFFLSVTKPGYPTNVANYATGTSADNGKSGNIWGANFSLGGPPLIVSSPQSQGALDLNSVTFSCGLSAAIPMISQWQVFDNESMMWTNIVDDDTFSSSHSEILHVIPLANLWTGPNFGL